MRKQTSRTLEAYLGPRGATWCVDFHWETLGEDVRGDPVECVALTLRSLPGWVIGSPMPAGETDPLLASQSPQPITTTLLRAIPWASVIDNEKRSAVAPDIERRTSGLKEPFNDAELERYRQVAYDGLVRQARRITRGRVGPVGRGRKPKYEPEHFARVAEVYLNSDPFATRSTPTLAVAAHFQVPRSTANKWVARARAMGLLTRQPRRGRRKQT